MSASTLSSSASVEEMREVAARICRDYLHGAWKSVSADDIKFRRISGGLSNFLYYVSLPDGYDNNNSPSPEPQKQVKRIRREPSQDKCEPKEVLLRVYGQSHGDAAMLTELVVFTLLSERNLGPKLHGIFPGGRIEEYIPARALKTGELSTPQLSMKIAEKMADIHSLNIPISKEPEWIWKTMGRWLKNIKLVFDSSRHNCSPSQRDIIEEIQKTDLAEEVSWLKSVIESSNYCVQFCHNDLQEGNILVKGLSTSHPANSMESLSSETVRSSNGQLQNGFREIKIDDSEAVVDSRDVLNGNASASFSEQNFDSLEISFNENGNDKDCDIELIIIDYEYCAYNYRGFDIANHFVEWTFDYTNKEHPYYFHKKHHYPTQEQRDAFIVQYLRTMKNSSTYVPSSEKIDKIVQEIHCFTMASHLFWTLWSIINVHQPIEFGYWEYAHSRLQEYRERKNEFINTYMTDLPLDSQ